MTHELPASGARTALDARLSAFSRRAAGLVGGKTPLRVVVSPYRFNPLGAHVDHQGGPVLARTLDQYTWLAFAPGASATIALHFDDTPSTASIDEASSDVVTRGETASDDETAADAHPVDGCRFAIADVDVALTALSDGQTLGHVVDNGDSRVRYAMATAQVLHAHSPLSRGLVGVVCGTLIAAGLSSSASVILAYLEALATVNEIALDKRTLVELVRRVENEHLGLNNGLQDQMSIVFGRAGALSQLDVDSIEATPVADPPTIDEVRWVLCYSGVSRELAAGSGFNTRVAECRDAASRLFDGAKRLGDVPPHYRTPTALATLPDTLARRARHGFTEMQRVVIGSDAWRTGDWRFFGELMNASCASSIDDYESGSEWLIALHRIASGVEGVHGSRFSGGGYGGCLVMLVARDAVERVSDTVLNAYLERYPDKRGVARCFVATAEDGVRLA